jgi:translation initiation factor 4A
MGSGGDGTSFFTEWEETYEAFDQMGLHENLLRGIYGYGERSQSSMHISVWLLTRLCTV